MRKILIYSAISIAACTAGAKDKLNPAGRMVVNSFKADISQITPMGGGSSDMPLQGLLLRLTDDADITPLLNVGFEMHHRINNIVSGTISLDRIDELENLDEVECISFGDEYVPMLDFARPASVVDDVQDGFESTVGKCAFDGTGVIAGMMDTGMEGNHVNFRTDDGTSRIQQLWHFTGTTGNSSVKNYQPGNMFRFITDNYAMSHATHVAGIMAGSYQGNAYFYKTANASFGSSTRYDDAPCPYYGTATGSDLAVAVGSLSNLNILDGVANIVDYAKSVGKPAVINLSIGSTTGPHDGTDLLGQAFAQYGKDVIICVASGNEGEASVFAGKTFTADDTEMKVQFVDNKATGYVDVWGNDERSFKFAWAVYNTGTRAIEIISEINPDAEVKINSSNAVFSKYFSGSIKSIAGVSSLNNRYQVYNDCSSVTPLSGNKNGKLAMVITGDTGQRIYAYGSTSDRGNAEFATDVYLPGWTNGTTDNSINSLACGENVITVGSYNSRAYWTCLDGNSYTLVGGITVGEISGFSSYGTSFNGDRLPVVAAPGCGIVSSINRYVTVGSDEQCARAYNQYESVYDYWGEMQGTSMACPMVSGIVALWLQADPTLDYARVMEVINATSVTDRYTRKAPERFGAGKIDALVGIKKVLDDKASVGAIFADDERNLIIAPVDGGYNVYVAGESAISVAVYDMTGRVVARASADSNNVDIATAQLPKGIYVIAATGSNSRHSRKIAL